jgi:hypothetical protein
VLIPAEVAEVGLILCGVHSRKPVLASLNLLLPLPFGGCFRLSNGNTSLLDSPLSPPARCPGYCPGGCGVEPWGARQGSAAFSDPTLKIVKGWPGLKGGTWDTNGVGINPKVIPRAGGAGQGELGLLEHLSVRVHPVAVAMPGPAVEGSVNRARLATCQR